MDVASEDQTVGLRYPKNVERAVHSATRLWRFDVERREFLIDSVFAAGAVSAASRDWMIGSPRESLDYSNGSLRVGMADVHEIRALGNEFERLSHEFGSQRIRRHMVNYLRHDVGPLLNRSRTDDVGRALMQTAAEFTASAGYMAVDCNELNLAERYYIQALGLANAAGSRGYGAQVMATHMGHLALYAQHPAEAVQLAQAARSGRQKDEPLSLTVAWVVEARGHARLGDSRACERALSEAERNFSNSSPGDSASYLHYFNECYLADTFAHCYRDLNQPKKARHHAATALRSLPISHTRRRAINTVILAHASVSMNEPEQAAKYGVEAVRLTHRLHSPRSLRRVLRLRQQLTPFKNTPEVARFLEHANTLLRATPASGDIGSYTHVTARPLTRPSDPGRSGRPAR